MEALARQHAEVKLRTVDIVTWSSKVAGQYHISSLPTIWLYEGGELLTKDRAAVLAKLNTLR